MNDINRTLTVDQYHEMIRTGALGEDDPVELLEGRLVAKMPRKPPHRRSTRRLRAALERVVPAGWIVDAQEAVTMADSEPEPDVSVIEGDEDRYLDRHPSPSEVALAAEVSDSSLQQDRTRKKILYAEARIPVYWIINLSDRQIEVYTEPSGPVEHPDYSRCDTYRPGDEVPVVIRGQLVGHIAAAEPLS